MQSTTQNRSRVISLDALRGLALLGILMMNIIAFAYPRAVYDNPFALGPLSTANEWQWLLSEVFFAEKFYALFACLFGAGIVMMAQRQSDPKLAGQMHYRRMFWLLLLGLLHAYGLWWGDILVIYAIGGMLIYLCRYWPARRLFWVGLLLQSVLLSMMVLLYVSWDSMAAAEQQDLIVSISPPVSALQAEIAAYQGSWWERAVYRVDSTLDLHSGALIALEFRMCGLMLVGMALLKWGVLTAERSLTFYMANGLTGVLLGVLLCGYGAVLLRGSGGTLPEFISLYRLPNYCGALPMAWGYLCLVMCLVKVADRNWQALMLLWLSKVGQLALTNYLLQTIICCGIFYGWGLGLFGQLDRIALTCIVLGIWIFQLLISWWWLEQFTMGPVERIWRNLTQRRWQPVLQRRA